MSNAQEKENPKRCQFEVKGCTWTTRSNVTGEFVRPYRLEDTGSMSDAVHALLWTRVRAALESRGALLAGNPNEMETARHARTRLGTDLVVRFVTEYYQERVYGGGAGLTDADAERLVAALEALSKPQGAPSMTSRSDGARSVAAKPMQSTDVPSITKVVTDLDEAVPYGLRELKAQQQRERAALERAAEEMRRKREIGEALEMQRVAAEAAERQRRAAKEEARLKQQEIAKQERERQDRDIAAQAEAAKKAKATIAATHETDRRRNALKASAPSRANAENPPRAGVNTSNAATVSEMHRKVQASPASRLVNASLGSEQDRQSDKGAELTDAQVRICGTALLLVGVLLFYATVYLPYQSAKNHEPVSLGSGPFMAPVVMIMGALMAVFGQGASKWLGSPTRWRRNETSTEGLREFAQNAKPGNWVFSVLVVVVCVAAGLWCDHWLKSAISSYGYK
jgi:hypothetical protein